MTESVRVLLLAADPGSRNFIIQALDASSTWTTVAASPGEARALLNANRYGLVITTNLGIPPWLAIDIVPEDRSYEAMFISGYWDDQITRECERRRLHPVRVPCDFKFLLEVISKMVSKVRQAAADAAGQREGLCARTSSDISTRREISANWDAGLGVLDFVETSRMPTSKVDGLAKLFGGEPDISNHPRSAGRASSVAANRVCARARIEWRMRKGSDLTGTLLLGLGCSRPSRTLHHSPRWSPMACRR